jgi:hypothetical protein
MKIIFCFPPRTIRCGGAWRNTFSEHMQVARQMGLGPYWQTMETVDGEHGQADRDSHLIFTVPDDFAPLQTNEPIV